MDILATEMSEMDVSTTFADVLPEIERWARASCEKIKSFWYFTEWRIWARLDLYAHLRNTMGRGSPNYTLEHSREIWGIDYPEVDITVEPCEDQSMKSVAIWICTQRPHYNWDNFQEFVGKFQDDWKLVQRLTNDCGGGQLEGGKLLFLGIGERAPDEKLLEFGGLNPGYWKVRGSSDDEYELYVYYLWMGLTKARR